MLYTPLTIKALRMAWDAHAGQTDRCSLPYIFHPFTVAFGMTDEYAACAALLHDVVEDTDVTLEDIRSAGFPEEVVRAVSLLTHREGVPYEEYVRALSSDPIAKAVKLADLRHNMDPARLPQVTEKDMERFRRYIRAQQILLYGDVLIESEAPAPDTRATGDCRFCPSYGKPTRSDPGQTRWICACGNSEPMSSRYCRECGRMRPFGRPADEDAEERT